MNSATEFDTNNFTVHMLNFDSLNNVLNSSQSNSIFITHQNVRSLRQNFKLLVPNICAFPKLPDLIFVTEIWIFESEVSDYVLPGYDFHVFTNETYAAGGVGVFVKTGLNCTSVKCTASSADILKTTLCINNDCFTFLCFYRFHSVSTDIFLNEFKALLTDTNCKNLVLLGDFNIDLLSDTELTDEYNSILVDHGLFSYINECTRPISGTCLDHIFGRFKDSHSDYHCINLDLNVSDHCLTGIFLPSSGLSKEKARPKTFSKINYDVLNSFLLAETWADIYQISDASLAYSEFIKRLKTYIAMSTTTTSFRNKQNEKLKPWISDSLLKKIKLKNKLGLKSRQNPLNQSLKKRFKKLSKEIKKNIPAVRDDFYKRQFSGCNGDVKKQWKLLNEISHKPARSHQDIALKINDVLCNDSQKIANEFNEYFGSIGSNEQVSNPLVSDLTSDARSANSFFFEKISALEIIRIINTLNNTNSCGHDRISNTLLKKIAYNISDILAHLFNLSVNSGVFPSDLKISIVIPLFKKGERTNKQNYRPISLLSCINKIFEKAIKKRMVAFLVKNSFFSQNQFGFREGMSTEDALLDFCTHIHQSLDKKRVCASFFVDITKAFDMVDHRILLSKLYVIGFRGSMHKWLASYLQNRSQRVKVGDSYSSAISIKLGVPQGSVLGPLLFLIYVNSIFQQSFRGRITAFADDLGITYNTANMFDVVCDVNYDCDILRNWFAAHRLIISNKTKLMFYNLVSSPQPEVDIIYHDPCCEKFNLQCTNPLKYRSDRICNEKCFKIECVSQFKYLGVLLDSKMSWNDHTYSLKLYLRSVIRKFYDLSKFCSFDVLKMFYFGVFHSKLNYGISCWGGAYSNKIKPLITLQKCVMRKMHRRDRMSHSFELFKSSNILPVRHLYYYQVLKQFFIKSNSSRIRRTDYNLRHTDLVNIPSFRTTNYQNTYSIVSCRLFNRLPSLTKATNRKNQFLKEVKIWLMNFNLNEIESLLRPFV